MNQIDSTSTDLERPPLNEIPGLCAEPGSSGAGCESGPVTNICQVGTALRSPSLLVHVAKQLHLSQSQITDLDIRGSLSHYQSSQKLVSNMLSS